MASLRSTLDGLAAEFTASILEILREASIADIAARANGRSPRLSAEDVSTALDQVVALLKGRERGLRAEEIRKELGKEPREMQRVLKEGLRRKTLKAEGRTRWTVYTAT
jgi:hypothetical protein